MSETEKKIHISEVLGTQLDWLAEHKGEIYAIEVDSMYNSQLAMANLAAELAAQGQDKAAIRVMQVAVSQGPLVVYDRAEQKIRVASVVEADEIAAPEATPAPAKLH